MRKLSYRAAADGIALSLCRRAHCKTLLGPETAALHSVVAPCCGRSERSSFTESGTTSGGPGGSDLERRARVSSAGAQDSEAGSFWAGLYRAGINLDGAYFLEGASERFAASVPEVSSHGSD